MADGNVFEIIKPDFSRQERIIEMLESAIEKVRSEGATNMAVIGTLGHGGIYSAAEFECGLEMMGACELIKQRAHQAMEED